MAIIDGMNNTQNQFATNTPSAHTGRFELISARFEFELKMLNLEFLHIKLAQYKLSI